MPFLGFLKCLTQCPKIATMMFSTKMTSGLDRTKMGKTASSDIDLLKNPLHVVFTDEPPIPLDAPQGGEGR